MNKYCPVCETEKPESDFYTNKGQKCGLDYCCKICNLAKKKEKRSATRAEYNATARLKAQQNPEKVKQYCATSRLKRTVAIRAEWQAWYAKNRDKVLARKRSDPRLGEYVRARQAAKLNATPDWSIKFFLEEAYDLARRRTIVTGMQWVVDHVVPLKSKRVCGLHAHTNVQVVPTLYNARKSNVWWPQMPTL